MKKILLNSIVLLTVVIGIGTLVSSVSACVCEMPGCTDPGALNYDPEATIDDGSCEYEELKGSITICKIITDSESNIIDGSGFPGTEFSISVAGQDITFTTPLTLNRSFWEDYSHEAQCIIISELDITEYFYSEEIYPSSGWEIPLYNDQFDVQVQSLDDSFILDLSNDDSDGHIVLTEQRPDRTLVVFNKQKGEEEIPGCTNLEAVNYDPEANIDDGTCEYPEPEKVTINAYKVVCDNESDLPNWTDSGAPALINENTAQDYVSQSQEACHLETDWDFQWGYSDVPKLSGDYVGHAPTGAGFNEWKNFDSSTGISGEPAIVAINELQETSRIWVREALKEGYIPFTNPPKDVAEDNVSAEMYCHNDILNYDNYDYIVSPVLGQTYYCIAFNTSKETEVPGCTDEEALNYDPEATVDDELCEYPELFSISGIKFNDQNNNGVNDSEPGLIGWTIELYVSEQLSSSTLTDTYGNYSFLNLDPGTYTVCEINQAGWSQTYPNGCHAVELIDVDLSEYDFGNHHLNFQILGCMDPEALNYSSEATLDDDTCIYKIPGCTDPNALNYNSQATVNDGSCVYGGGPSRPRFSIDKTAAEEFVNAGDTASYTIVVECLGSGVARNTVLKDILPEGFIYEDTGEDGEWDLGDMMRGDTKTVTFKVVVSEETEAGKYINTAEVQASNSDNYKDTAELEVGNIPVKGEEFFPELEIDKSVDKSSASAGSYVLFTIKIKNIGDAPGVNLVVKDELPQGFITDDGRSEVEWDISLLKEGETWERSFSVYIQSDVPDGRYENVVVASGENHPQEVKDMAVVVLGSLPHTGGISISGLLKEWVKAVEPVLITDYLIIPKIGVEIPIVEGADDSALEQGAWLLPQTTTPDLLKNTALAAHRFKYKPPHKETFYLLDKVSEGDNLLVFWKGEKYVYSVNSISVVDPNSTEVLLDTSVPTLTLITCHPLFSDTSRLVVQGELVI